MKPHEAAEQLEQLMAQRDALTPPASAARDSAEFRAFLAAEQKVGDFITEHETELEPLRLPRDGMTAEKYQVTLERLDGELAWLKPHAAHGARPPQPTTRHGRTGWHSWRITSQMPGPGHPGRNPSLNLDPSLSLRRSRR
jgi:hypothetical protein